MLVSGRVSIAIDPPSHQNNNTTKSQSRFFPKPGIFPVKNGQVSILRVVRRRVGYCKPFVEPMFRPWKEVNLHVDSPTLTWKMGEQKCNNNDNNNNKFCLCLYIKLTTTVFERSPNQVDLSCNEKMYEENPIVPQEKGDNNKQPISMLVSNQSLKLFISLKSRNKNGEKIRSRATYSDSSLQVSPFFESSTRKGDINKMSTNLAGGMRKTTLYPRKKTKKHLQTQPQTTEGIKFNQKKQVFSDF